jgi:hypothetical protein
MRDWRVRKEEDAQMDQLAASAGYSGTPLPKKLGIKEGQRLAFINAPPDYEALLGAPISHEASLGSLPESFDLIHYFTGKRADFETALPNLKRALSKNGALWISWPKKASGVPTDLTENIIRDLALAAGLVDVKVCAVDSVWSGLKLVYRTKDR